MDDISITIVCYHNYKDIKSALYSIEKYTDLSIKKKIYIVDNSCLAISNEQKKEFIEFINQWEDIEYLDTHDNLGFGRGHNYVLSLLNSKYHGIVNPDILLLEDSFSKIISYMNKEIEAGVVVPRIEDESGRMIKAYRREVTIWDMVIRFCCPGLFNKRKNYHTMDEKDYSKPFDVPFAQGSFLIVRTELFKSLNGFDDRFFMYMEDADFCKRVNKVSAVKYFPYTTVVHKWEKGSHKSLKLFKIHIQSMIQYFTKWR